MKIGITVPEKHEIKNVVSSAIRAGKKMKKTHYSLTACVPASGTACEDARRSTERRAISR